MLPCQSWYMERSAKPLTSVRVRLVALYLKTIAIMMITTLTRLLSITHIIGIYPPVDPLRNDTEYAFDNVIYEK